MSQIVIRIAGLASGVAEPGYEVPVGKYVADYWPDANEGAGLLATSANLADAKRFPDHVAALEFWRQQSTVDPTRIDGTPNRPLTALTAEMLRLDETPDPAEAGMCRLRIPGTGGKWCHRPAGHPVGECAP